MVICDLIARGRAAGAATLDARFGDEINSYNLAYNYMVPGGPHAMTFILPL